MTETGTKIYVLGGAQTDFARNFHREGLTIFDLFREITNQALDETRLQPSDINVGHVGNFAAEVYVGQGQLGGFFGHLHPEWVHLPASRHEAACASGSMALLAAMADLKAGFYDCACVVGIELMRVAPGAQAAENLRGAAWADRESLGSPFVWPYLFGGLVDEYDDRYGIDMAYLRQISAQNHANGRRNPRAQTRHWQFSENSYAEDAEANPVVIGRIRKQDCGQVTDGAAVVFLATEAKAEAYARRCGISLNDLPYIKGWGHRNAPILTEQKYNYSRQSEYIFPHVHQVLKDAIVRAGMPNVYAVDGMEVHDCFNITQYMIMDHLGLYPPGEAWRAIEDGLTAPNGKLPINPSGGLIGLGHPVGATGVRMALDCFRQVTGSAGDYQIDNALNMMTFNLGGSATTCATLIIGR